MGDSDSRVLVRYISVGVSDVSIPRVHSLDDEEGRLAIVLHG